MSPLMPGSDVLPSLSQLWFVHILHILMILKCPLFLFTFMYKFQVEHFHNRLIIFFLHTPFEKVNLFFANYLYYYNFIFFKLSQ